jgi:diguanylate cyclase (GGDEF)-like protein
VLPRTDRSAVILLAKQLDNATIGQIGASYLLNDAHLMTGERPRERGWSQAKLTGSDGKMVGVIHWRSPKPGEELVRKIAPALAVFASVLALAAWLVMRKGRQIARELTKSEERASHMAFNDSLTGLPNRAALDRAFTALHEEQAATGEPLGVLCIDVDRFKAVNDSYGHPAGDYLLRHTADRLKALSEECHVLGRFGGDEFMLICPAPTAASSARLGELIVSALAAPFEIGMARVFVGASVGILTVDPDEPIDAPEAFRRADLAMYRAKVLGRNQYAFYEPELDDAVRARRETQEALRHALAADGLDVHYQPQVDETATLVGCEALVRWPEATTKGIPTAAFVRLAEETGLIDELGSKVMRRVFADAARWPGLPVAINLLAAQLRADDFTERLEALVAKTGVDPASLEFEITEGVLLDQNEDTTDKLERLRALGSRIALDDFGTGYCGLSYLHLYPIDALKIDMTFTGLLGKEPRGEALVETIVTLAKALDLTVIAEGVETEEQRQFLLAAGCRRFQGYLTGAPMPAEEFARRFAGVTTA